MSRSDWSCLLWRARALIELEDARSDALLAGMVALYRSTGPMLAALIARRIEQRDGVEKAITAWREASETYAGDPEVWRGYLELARRVGHCQRHAAARGVLETCRSSQLCPSIRAVAESVLAEPEQDCAG